MPCQPTVGQVINYATDAFQIDDVRYRFWLYAKGEPKKELPLDKTLPQLTGTTSLYEFILVRSPRSSRLCEYFAVIVVAFALAVMVWMAINTWAHQTDGSGRLFGGSRLSESVSTAGGSGGSGIANSMGTDIRGRLAGPDGNLPFYTGEWDW